MAHSIEGRVPLLDREIISFVFALPDSLKIRNKQGKWMFKNWLDSRHPQLNAWQPKRGFTLPVHEWMEKKREKLAHYISGHPAMLPIVDQAKLHHWLAKPLDAKGAKLLFNLLCLAVWYDIHILGKSGDVPL
jgi:asparagine synthase (glutamine-hydrolysing)